MGDPKLFEIFHGLTKPYANICSGNSVFVTDTCAPSVLRIAGILSVPRRGIFMILQPLLQSKLLFERNPPPPFQVGKKFKGLQNFSEEHYPNTLLLWTDMMIIISMMTAKNQLLDQVFVSIPGTHYTEEEALEAGSLEKKLLQKHLPRFPLSFFFQSKFLFLINQQVSSLSL
jgi:hypothetical protein